MNLRRASIEDLKALNRLCVHSKSYWGYPAEWIARWKEELRLSEKDLTEQQVLLLEVEDQIAGFCAIHQQKERYEITHLWLLPTFMGKGLGKTLLNEVLGRFVTTTKPIWVLADPNAEEFYKKNRGLSP